MPIDFVSIHVYNEITHFASSDSYVNLMKTYERLKDIPIIFSEWNHDWTVGSVGSEKDTNINAAYGAKRMFTAITNDNVDYVFYFTPVDAWQPQDLLCGDSGIYTIDGHRKAAANMFAMYNDLESECLQTSTQFQMNQNAMTYGLITKNSENKRVTALLFNYSKDENDLDIQISNLPYDGAVKITTKIIDADSGNYCKDYLAGVRGYSETPNELPDTYSEVRSGFTEYKETVSMTPYSVMEIILEPTEDALQEKVLLEKGEPKINVAANKAVTATSEDISNIDKNAKEPPILWSVDRLTDGQRLSIDIVNEGTTNMGYRSESFDNADNNVQLTVDLQETQTINTVKLYPLNDRVHGGKGMPVDFTIDVSEDRENWTTVYTENSFDNNGSHKAKNITFPNTAAQYVRLNVTKLSEESDGYRLQLAELEIYNDNDVNEKEKYVITFNDYNGEELTHISVTDGTIPSYDGTPTRAQDAKYTYEFSGWYPELTAAAENKTYTAQYREIPRIYTVTLNANGGTINSGEVSSYMYGTSTVLPTNVTNENYTFSGWYENEDFKGAAITEITANDTGDKVYYAKWVKKSSAEYLDVLNAFKDKLIVEKVAGDAETMLVISNLSDEPLPELTLYTAIYSSDKTLKTVSVTPCLIGENGNMIVYLTEPQIEDEENYKLMLWNASQSPIIAAIDIDTGFFRLKKNKIKYFITFIIGIKRICHNLMTNPLFLVCRAWQVSCR